MPRRADDVPRLADKLNRLIDRRTDADGRPWTNVALAQALGDRLGSPVSEGAVRHLRAGLRDNPGSLLLNGLALVLHAPASYWFSDAVEAAVLGETPGGALEPGDTLRLFDQLFELSPQQLSALFTRLPQLRDSGDDAPG